MPHVHLLACPHVSGHITNVTERLAPAHVPLFEPHRTQIATDGISVCMGCLYQHVHTRAHMQLLCSATMHAGASTSQPPVYMGGWCQCMCPSTLTHTMFCQDWQWRMQKPMAYHYLHGLLVLVHASTTPHAAVLL